MIGVSDIVIVVFIVGAMAAIAVFALRILVGKRSALNPEVSIEDWLRSQGLTKGAGEVYTGHWRGYPVRLHLQQTGSGRTTPFHWVASAQVEPDARLPEILEQFHRLTLEPDGWISYPTWSPTQILGEATRDAGQVWHSLNDPEAYGGPFAHHAKDALATVVERARFADTALGRKVDIDYGVTGWDGDRDADGQVD